MVKTTMWEEDFVQFKVEDVLHATQSLIAVSSILLAHVDHYAATGSVQIAAVQHCGNVVDEVIERLGLSELIIKQAELPWS